MAYTRLLGPIAAVLLCVSCPKPTVTSPQALAQENACVQSLQISDYEGAKIRCELCLEYDESIPECVNGLGLVAFGQNDTPTAIKYFTQAIKMSETFAQARNNLGAIYFKQLDYSTALPLFQAAVEIDPGYQDARYNYALTYLRMAQKASSAGDNKTAQANYALAQDQYLKLIAVNPGYANGYRDLGLIMTYLASMETVQSAVQADLNKANEYFKQCLQINPNNETCHESYGHTLLYQNQYDMALYQFVQCLAENKNNSVCIQGLDASYQGSQIKNSALTTYVQMLKKNPDDPQGHYGYCSALFTANMNDMAVSECQEAIKLDPKQCSAYFLLGMYYKKVLNSTLALSNCRSYVLCDQNRSDDDQISQCQSVITTLAGQ
jgi:tetratricopeptide (TPR) repeat protein